MENNSAIQVKTVLYTGCTRFSNKAFRQGDREGEIMCEMKNDEKTPRLLILLFLMADLDLKELIWLAPCRSGFADFEPVSRFHSAVNKLSEAFYASCEFGAVEQTVGHVALDCLIFLAQHGTLGLTDLDDETVPQLLI